VVPFLKSFLDAVFIIWLNMGVKGAALGTVISQFVSVAIFVGYYLFRKSYLLISLPSLKPDFQIIKEILAVGISALASTLTSSIMGILFMRMLLGYGGDLAVSAFGNLNRIMMFTIMPGDGDRPGYAADRGFNYGAKRYDRIIKSLKIASISSTLICFAAFYLQLSA
jgi:Na+-driven multidrug efflux pump